MKKRPSRNKDDHNSGNRGGYNRSNKPRKGFTSRDRDENDSEKGGVRRPGRKKPYKSDRFESGKRSSSGKGKFSGRSKDTSRPEYEKSEKIQRAAKRHTSKAKLESREKGIRLNKYIANAGICSRREADSLIANGDIKVNGKVVTEMGHKVQRTDKVQYKGKTLKNEKPLYVLLNKPKDFITTTDDPQQRKTVMDLVQQAGDQRMFPVGRLDRQTTGLLLLTNDGDLAEKLAHPANNIKKVYQVDLDKPITEAHFNQIQEGITLDDGSVEVDEVVVLDKDRKILGLEIHIGRNRIVRRLFEHLGYDVVRLDRVFYAGLTKRDLPRGHWRYLTEEEVVRLKYFK